MLKIAAYIIFLIIFTFCYYWINKRLLNIWICLIFPLLLAAAVTPMKYWFNYARPTYGDALAGTWLKITLMLFACLIVFNVAYVFVNHIVGTQVSFHKKCGQPNVGFVKSFIANATNIISIGHLFFYVGGVILSFIIVTKY